MSRRLVLVVGVGRSGTSLFTGMLGQLGFHVPQPEVKADDTNPRGFSEPRWVVDFHTRLLRARRVTVNDARPVGWEKTATAAEDAEVYAELRDWLDGQFREAPNVVVKDPRTAWFLPLWTRASADLGVDASFVTMLRHPAESIASATKSYGTWQPPASRAAAWINVTLETERATRGARRAFVRHEDLLRDWPRELNRAGDLLELSVLAEATPERNPEVDAFVDPTLHRNRVGWDELDVPARMRDMTEDVWQRVQRLAEPGGDTPEVHGSLDEARDAFGELYAEAEAIAQSSISAAKPRKKPAPPTPAPAQADGKPAPAPATLRTRAIRTLPAPARRGLQRAVRSLRRS
jgi:hypothetical protein